MLRNDPGKRICVRSFGLVRVDPFLRVLQHSLKIVSIVVGADHGTVDLGVHDHHIVMLCVGHALSELTFNGLFGLPLT